MNIEDSGDFIFIKLDLSSVCHGLCYRFGKMIENCQLIINNKNICIAELKEQITEQSAIIGKLCRQCNNSDNNNNVIISDKYKCISCYDNIKSILFIPCLHMLYCENCVDDSPVCPICRESITSKKNIFSGDELT